MGETERAVVRGGCLCGRVRYSLSCKPLSESVCHCSNCQKQTGAPFAVHFAMPKACVGIEGETRTFLDKGDSGEAVHRVFCPNCSSPILANPDLKPEISFVFASTLDDIGDIRPTSQIFCKSAQHWVALDGLQSFPGMPPL